MKNLGQLVESDGRYEFRISEMGLIVRGDHPEWVMEAASEVIAINAKSECEGRIDELEALVEFEEASEFDVDAAKHTMKERFEIVPQCLVTLGRLDYKWVAETGRAKLEEEFNGHPVSRIQDMSLTKNDTFLENEEGVDMSSETK